MLHAISQLRAHNDPAFHDTADPNALVRRSYTMARDDDATLARIAQYCLAHEGRTGRDYVLVEHPDAGDGKRTLELIAADELTYGGRPITEVAPCIEWGYLIYLTVFRRCQYSGGEEECRFCDINENYRQQKAAGRPYVTVKSVEEVVEAMSVIAAMG